MLAVLVASESQPKPMTAEQMEEVRALPWFEGWRQAVFQAIDRCFDADASTVDLLGITGDTAEELVQKADFSQKFARKFILLNSSSDQANDGDTSRDELIAMAMQASFDQQVHLCLYTGGNDSKAPRRILRCSTCS